METVIDRLRASKIKNAQDVTHQGYEVGTAWAEKTAEYDQLKRLAALNLDEWFTGEPSAPYGWAGHVAFAAAGTERDEMTHEDAQEFWELVLRNDRDERLQSAEFLQGFVEGAVHAFEQVEDKL